MTVTKLERDGKVAVVYSPGYGAGWSTWNPDHAELLLFDSEIAQAVIDGDTARAAEIATAKTEAAGSEAYTGGADQLQVAWFCKGTRFRIDEYDGSESIVLLDRESYHVA